MGFNPLGYHTGSVWPHDTTIAIQRLVRAGVPEAAGSLAAGLVAASAPFDAQLPELFAGHASATAPRPVPYPAACRPQAWAAASSVAVLAAILGLAADVPAGTLTVAPLISTEYRPLKVSGLRVAGQSLAIEVDADGTPRVPAPSGLKVRAAGVSGALGRAPARTPPGPGPWRTTRAPRRGELTRLRCAGGARECSQVRTERAGPDGARPAPVPTDGPATPPRRRSEHDRRAGDASPKR